MLTRRDLKAWMTCNQCNRRKRATHDCPRSHLTFAGCSDLQKTGFNYPAGKLARRRKRLVEKLIERDGPHCFYCYKPMDKPTIEHLQPRSKGGTNDLENLFLAHSHCNVRAADKLPEQKLKMRRKL